MNPLHETIAGVSARRLCSVHDRLSLPTPDCLRAPTGALSFAVLPIEDWATNFPLPGHALHLPHHYHRLLIADRDDGDPKATFALKWDQGWHPQLFVKWAEGTLYPTLRSPEQRPYALCGHFCFHKNEWIHLTIAWDHSAPKLRLYANGIRVAAEDRFLKTFGGQSRPDPVGPTPLLRRTGSLRCRPELLRYLPR